MGNGAVVGWLTPSMAAGLIWVLACLGFFFLLPYGFLRLIRADRPDDPDHPGQTGQTGQAALRFDLRGTHWRIYLLLYLMMLPVIFAASLRPEFIRVYPFVAIARSSLGYFALWEVAYLSQFFALEFFFRGFLLFTLARHMPKAVAIAAMVVPYTMIHYHKPMLEALGAIIGGCLLAVNLGHDADTTAAVYGQLAGAYYGAAGIPAPWRDRLAHVYLITDFADRLHDLAQ